jgi:hypothetical protein
MLQIYEVANFNLLEFASIYNEFVNTEEPKELTVQYMDKNGKINTIQIKNVAAMKQEVKADIDAEAKARMQADAAIQDTIAQTSKDLIARINTEAQTRESYDKVLDSKIDKEIDRATKAEKALEVTINGVKTELVKSIDDLKNLLQQEIERAQKAESDLDSKIEDEITRAKTAESNLTAQIENEVERAKASETKLDKKITDEIVRAQDAENKLDKKISDEITRAQNAENSLEDKINNEIARAEKAESDLKNSIDAVKKELANEEETRAKNDGDLVFNDDIRDENGNLADNLTDAVNIVDHRLTQAVNNLKASDEEIKKYVDESIEKLINGAPQVLDTLNELADALGDDPNFAKTVSDKIAKVDAKIGDLTKLTTENKNNIVNAINELQNEINTERQTRIAADTKLNNMIEAEVARAQKAEDTLTASINAEVERAQAAENKLAIWKNGQE